MIIPEFKFSFYGIIIVFAIILGMLYIHYNVKKAGYNNRHISLYFIMYITFAFIFGKIYTIFVYGKGNILTAGLSAYGGLIGVVLAAIIFEKILTTDGKIIKYTILSLPLVYGLTKIGCFISGCCGGIPYEGIFKIKYISHLNIWQFPIQIVETITFLLIFVVCHLLSNKKNINYLVLFLVVAFKFILDFLRYDHINTIITRNQIFSIILFILIIITYIIDKKRFEFK